MLNHITIMGRLGADPELRHTQSGAPVASFRLAVDRDFKDKNSGERQTDWINVVAWRSTGEFAAKYLSKGRMAVVEGRLQMRDWTDKNGSKRTTAEVVADSIYFCDSKKQDQNRSVYDDSFWNGVDEAYANDPQAQEFDRSCFGQPQPGQFAELEGDDGDLPF